MQRSRTGNPISTTPARGGNGGKAWTASAARPTIRRSQDVRLGSTPSVRPTMVSAMPTHTQPAATASSSPPVAVRGGPPALVVRSGVYVRVPGAPGPRLASRPDVATAIALVSQYLAAAMTASVQAKTARHGGT